MNSEDKAYVNDLIEQGLNLYDQALRQRTGLASPSMWRRVWSVAGLWLLAYLVLQAVLVALAVLFALLSQGGGAGLGM